MIRTWQFHEAKRKFSQVVEEAIRSGPQLITKRGVEAVILLSYAEYRRLIATQRKLSTFFRESPLTDGPLDLHRDTAASEAA